MVKAFHLPTTRRYIVLIQNKQTKLVSRLPIKAKNSADAIAQAVEEKGETHDILSAILY
jgi:hypothetical protein